VLGRPRSLYVGLRLLQGPVFFVNSRPGLFSAAFAVADVTQTSPPSQPRSPPNNSDTHVNVQAAKVALFPKLRAQIAEFLSEGSPDHLRTLILADQCRFAVRTPTVRATKLFSADDSPSRGMSSAASRPIIGVPSWQIAAGGAGISTGFSIAYA
jgi:hypothetical protein